MNTLIENKPAQSAWVVFTGQADVRWLRFLRPGYRHCFVILNDGERWVSVDPMLNRMDVQAHHHVPASFNLPEWLAGRGQKVIPAPVFDDIDTPAPFAPFTCVEAVKRVLGLHARFVFTPWQLFRHLKKINFQSQQGDFAWAA